MPLAGADGNFFDVLMSGAKFDKKRFGIYIAMHPNIAMQLKMLNKIRR
jgi:hypothetical protein